MTDLEPRKSIAKIKDQTTKRCSHCKEIKSLDEFYVRKDGRPGSWCKRCTSQKTMDRYKTDPMYFFDIHLRKMYGIDIAEYQAMLKAQKGRCAICGKLPPIKEGKRELLHVDHCHRTNKIRGLLCGMCNHGLGRFKDSVANLLAAIKYLEVNK